MKMKLIFALVLGSSLVLANPVLADKRDRDFRKYDSYRYEHRTDHRRHVDRRRDAHGYHRYHWRSQGSDRHAYRSGFRDGRKHHHSHNRYYRRYDDDWYKWFAGAYLAGELIHHFHGSRICYDHH